MSTEYSNGDMKGKSIHFFMPMIPPTVTHQEHKITVTKNGKARFYDPAEVKATRLKLRDYVVAAMPLGTKKALGPVALQTTWIWPEGPKHPAGYKCTKPDTDNMIKMLKDIMTQLDFWEDDALVAVENTQKLYGPIPGIYVDITYL